MICYGRIHHRTSVGKHLIVGGLEDEAFSSSARRWRTLTLRNTLTV